MANQILEELEDCFVRVFILGAGFSAPLGAPVMHNFLSRSRELYSEIDKNSKAGLDFRRVFDFQNSLGGAQRRFNIDVDNIETLYGIAEWGKGINSDGSKVYNALKTLVCSTLTNSISYDLRPQAYRTFHFNSQLGDPLNYSPPAILTEDTNDPCYGPPCDDEALLPDRLRNAQWGMSAYEAFLLSLKDNPSKKRREKNFFIVLNYDTVLEHYLDRLEIKYKYLGLEGNSQVSECDFFLLKPHGSVNWAEQDGEIKVRNNCIAEQAVIIPPSWSKMSKTYGEMTNESIARIWKLGISVIHHAAQLHVIGFSLPETDQYIRSLLVFGLSKNINLSTITIGDLSQKCS